MKKKTFIILLFLALLVILTWIFDASEGFSEFYIMNVAPVLKAPFTFISSLLPFSVFESSIIIFFILTVTFVLSFASAMVLKLFKKPQKNYYKIYFSILIFSLLFAFASFVLTFKPSYTRKSVEEHMGLEEQDMNADNIRHALDRVIEELEKLEPEINYSPTRPTSYNMSFDQLSKAVLKAADKASEKYSFLQKYGSRAKPLAFSTPLAYTGISGIYGYFTGEANINTSFAHYSLPFTIAHEYSHQRGIGPEMEAEFSAFLICMESDDPYIRYSGYSQVAITLANLLFEHDENLFYDAFSRFPDFLYYDIYHSSMTYEEFSKTQIDEIASSINNIYLISNSDEGIISYSLSAKLYVAYLLR